MMDGWMDGYLDGRKDQISWMHENFRVNSAQSGIPLSVIMFLRTSLHSLCICYVWSVLYTGRPP